MIAVFCYGASQVKVHFDFNFFVSEESAAYGYLQASDKYFNNGPGVTFIYIESDTLDWSDPVNQDKVTLFNTKLEDCTGCE
jgi:predicted RND superfamily exporter protein|mmetsp:Transcript_33888/g.39859  ORF Transcript_33888/g.39859 Transcript_33888/m.39859 type:complete len:81 (-) Transcript_33888:1175-1417(-)